MALQSVYNAIKRSRRVSDMPMALVGLNSASDFPEISRIFPAIVYNLTEHIHGENPRLVIFKTAYIGSGANQLHGRVTTAKERAQIMKCQHRLTSKDRHPAKPPLLCRGKSLYTGGGIVERESPEAVFPRRAFYGYKRAHLRGDVLKSHSSADDVDDINFPYLFSGGWIIFELFAGAI